jgi:hypothetical protein
MLTSVPKLVPCHLPFFRFLLQEDEAAVLIQEPHPDAAPWIADRFLEKAHAPLPSLWWIRALSCRLWLGKNMPFIAM